MPTDFISVFYMILTINRIFFPSTILKSWSLREKVFSAVRTEYLNIVQIKSQLIRR
jgi:hypothetical protein